MKKFITHSVLFITGFIIIFWVITLYYYKNILPEENFFKHMSFYEKLNKNYKVLIIGDSHASYGIRNEILPSSFFNFSHPGPNLRGIFLKIKKFYIDNPSLKLIILPVDYHLFNPNFSPTHGLAETINYASPKEIQNVYGLDNTFYIYYLKFCDLIPLILPKNRSFMVNYLMNDSFFKEKNFYDFNEHGDFFYTSQRNWTEFDVQERESLAVQKVKSHGIPATDSELIETYKDIILFCEAHNIKVVGVKYPLSLEYKNAAEKQHAYMIDQVYEKIFLYEILDYRDVFDANQDYFKDESHINSRGAKRFTSILVRDVLERFPGLSK